MRPTHARARCAATADNLAALAQHVWWVAQRCLSDPASPYVTGAPRVCRPPLSLSRSTAAAPIPELARHLNQCGESRTACGRKNCGAGAARGGHKRARARACARRRSNACSLGPFHFIAHLRAPPAQHAFSTITTQHARRGLLLITLVCSGPGLLLGRAASSSHGRAARARRARRRLAQAPPSAGSSSVRRRIRPRARA